MLFQPEIFTNMLEHSSPEQQVKGRRSWSWLSVSSHFSVGGGWVWSGDKLHYPGCEKYRLHGGAVGSLQHHLPGWNLEHVHSHPQKKYSKPANEHRGGPRPAGAAKMELSGWCHCRYTNVLRHVYLNLPVYCLWIMECMQKKNINPVSNRLTTGHVGSLGQLQCHSKGTEITFQHVTRRRRYLGKRKQWPHDTNCSGVTVVLKW